MDDTTVHRVTISPSAQTHSPSRQILGCHLDAYGHQLRALSSQLLLDESFESEQSVGNSSSLLTPWRTLQQGGASTVGLDTQHRMHGLQSLRVTVRKASAHASIANRGQFGHGLALVAHRSYEVSLFALSHGAEASVMVSLIDWRSNRTLAAAHVRIGGSSFSRYTVSLPPLAAGTGCGMGSDGRCAGEFQLGVSGLADVSLDFVTLQPAAWGRFAGLPVLASGVATLQSMGVSAIRFGGSFASGPNNSAAIWTRWTGPPWSRAAAADPCWPAWKRGHWHPSWCAVLNDFGPFEFLALADAMGVTPVLTTSASSSPASLADLVEYALGNASTSTLARARAANGRVPPYPLTFVELGNEEVNPLYVEQAHAMEARARKLGLGGRLRYLWPAPGPTTQAFLSNDQLHAAKQLVPRIDAQLVDSVHLGHRADGYLGGGGVDIARRLFDDASYRGFEFGVACTETNAKRQDMSRALMEGGDLNQWLGEAAIAKRLHGRYASFCVEHAPPHLDDLGFTQGLASFLPNTTYLQPPGWVHAMVSDAWQPLAVPVSWTRPGPATVGDAWNATFTSSAARSKDGTSLVLRITSNASAPIRVLIVLEPAAVEPHVLKGWDNATYVARVLSAPSLDAINTPAAPRAVAPVQHPAASVREPLQLPAHSFAVVKVSLS